MLKLGESRDATAMFEAHHPLTDRKRLEAILAKHEIKEGPNCTLLDKRDDEKNEFTFEWPEYEMKSDGLPEEAPVSPFARELRSRVRALFASEAKRRGVPILQATKATPWRWMELTILLGLFVATLPAFLRGEWWTLLATPLTYWVAGVNVFHDASHFALSRDWRVNLVGTYYGFWFSSPFEWYHQHVIGHHAYPNIPKRDPDLYHNGTFERHTKTLRHRPMHSHQHLTFYPIWFIGTTAMNFLKPVQMLISGWYNRAVAMVQYPQWRVWQHVLGRVCVFCLTKVLPFLVIEDFYRALIFAIVPEGIVSVCFMISSQVNHLSHENIDVSDKDYYKHQVVTGHSFGNDGLSGLLNFYFTGGLNLQIEHHLFPTVNHCHLQKIRPIVKQLCKKHDVFYHESTGLTQALKKYYDHMVEYGNPLVH